MPRVFNTCEVCKKIFSVYISGKNLGKYCSRKCWSTVVVKNLKERMKGKKHSDKSIAKMKLLRVGENHWNWKGEKTCYTAVHKWVERHKGRPQLCEICGTTSSSERYDWANKDHKYRRELNDYIRLCRKCHRVYDKKHNNFTTRRV